MSAASNMVWLQALSFLLVTQSYFVSAEFEPGSMTLTSGAFDKVIEKHKAVLVKFDEKNAIGSKQDTFREVARASIHQPELLVAEVSIPENDKENEDLAERYEITKEMFPAYRLFRNGDTVAPLGFTGDTEDAEAIKNFVTEKTDLWLGRVGCLEEFDKLLKEFLGSPTDKRAAVLARAEQAAQRLAQEEGRASADIYVKTMRKVVEKGDSFIKTESSRVEKLLTRHVTEKKMEEINNRLNILATFRTHVRDEL